MKILRSMALAITLGILSLPVHAMTTVYDINLTVGSGSVTGTIETNSLGVLSTGDIVAWDLTLDDGLHSNGLSSSGANDLLSTINLLTASPTELFFDFDLGLGGSLIVTKTIGGWQFQALDTVDGGAVDIQHNFLGLHGTGFLVDGGQLTFGTATTALSEPSTLGLCGAGFLLTVLTRRRKAT
jgi:hypothetical protein